MTVVDNAERERILDVALAELAVKGVDLTLEGVAARAGVDTGVVKQIWANTPEVYTATILEFGRRSVGIPDTGTLRGDLLDYARSYADLVNSPIGRRLIHAVLVSPRDWDLSDARSAFAAERNNRRTVIVRRGIERGECSPETDPARFMELLGGCLCLSVLYYDRPISEADCDSVVDLLLYGIARKQ
ncbi:MAG: TetR-like C-terminal domain-containing protein [Mycobacterium sp.]